LVNVVRQLHLETDHFLKERAALYVSWSFSIDWVPGN
jgi:hypothetical protein